MKINFIYNSWNELKQKLNREAKRPRRQFSEGEIWWCAVGRNIGVEIYGKGKYFARPVLVLRKWSRYSFFGIPLSSKEHDGSYYERFVQGGNVEFAVLAQARTFSSARLHNRIGQMDEVDFAKIKQSFIKLLDESEKV